MRGELPAAIVLHIDVLRADSKTWSAGHFNVAISGQHGRLAINADLRIAEVKGFVPGGALGNRGDVLRFGLGSAVGVRIGEIVGEQTLERRFILLDRGPRPADGDLADCFHRIVGEERRNKYGKDSDAPDHSVSSISLAPMILLPGVYKIQSGKQRQVFIRQQTGFRYRSMN